MHISGSGARRVGGAAMGSPVLSAAPSSPPNQIDYKSVSKLLNLPFGCVYLLRIHVTALEARKPELT